MSLVGKRFKIGQKIDWVGVIITKPEFDGKDFVVGIMYDNGVLSTAKMSELRILEAVPAPVCFFASIKQSLIRFGNFLISPFTWVYSS